MPRRSYLPNVEESAKCIVLASEDVEDYMSEEFLMKCEDVRPSVLSVSAARKYKIELGQCTRQVTNKRLRVNTTEEEARNEALNKPLSSDSKGFRMLTKMGFKAGTKLGKGLQDSNGYEDPGQGGSGLKEPLAINLKLDKTGLGHKTVQKEKMAAADRVRQFKNKAKLILTEDFDNRLKEKARYRTIYKDYLMAQKVCYELDARKGLECPTKPWYWPLYALPPEQEEGEDLSHEETEDTEQSPNYQTLIDKLSHRLSAISGYTRSVHCYCVWCAVTYKDATDMENNCPGCDKDIHETDYEDL